jgi:hypothetical protein
MLPMIRAEEWVRDYSKANASGRSLMFALARFAKGCVAVCTAQQLLKEAHISRAELYRVFTTLPDYMKERVKKKKPPNAFVGRRHCWNIRNGKTRTNSYRSEALCA